MDHAVIPGFRNRIHIPASIRNRNVPHAEKPKYSCGDTVMHPSEGICNIEKITPMRFGDSPEEPYYVLRPTMDKASNVVYMPVNRGNTVLRQLLREADIEEIISRSAEYDGLWIDDSKQRKDSFTKILSEGNYSKMIRMIQEIHIHSDLRIASGKRPCQTDETILEEAESLLHQEFSYVLQLSNEDTVEYIRRRLSTPALSEA